VNVYAKFIPSGIFSRLFVVFLQRSFLCGTFEDYNASYLIITRLRRIIPLAGQRQIVVTSEWFSALAPNCKPS